MTPYRLFLEVGGNPMWLNLSRIKLFDGGDPNERRNDQPLPLRISVSVGHYSPAYRSKRNQSCFEQCASGTPNCVWRRASDRNDGWFA